MKKLKKKQKQLIKKFKNYPKVHLKCSNSNLFVSLTNKFNKLITCSSSGSRILKEINVVKDLHKLLKKLCVKLALIFLLIN